MKKVICCNGARGLSAFSFVFIFLAVITVSATACGGQGEPSIPPSSPSPTGVKTPVTTNTFAPGTYAIVFIQGDKQLAALTIEDIKKLPQVAVTLEGKSESGPTFLSALSAAGVKDFNEVTVKGMTKGRIATAELTLKMAEINDKVILDISNQGTTKLAGENIPESKWIIDVSEVVVR